MGLRLCNNFPRPIWTSIMFYSPESCGGDGGDFEMMGWWKIDPGVCALVYANDVDVNRYWYFYADSFDGVLWSGPFGANVSLERFGGDQWCYGAQRSTSDLKHISYREIDIGDAEDCTITFVP
ncbi:DUF1036 domain-containing protein [Janthinobacterium agaricidamnosum]|uniref:DUF1036 domain-containing protein n=1 Tax=Janthinobacterium agaricidamnosum TaxID=55508 RepID=UPI00068A1428|nr:DUF1036 domain-containing protein [Janthinobacterium agaricidamnosum]